MRSNIIKQTPLKTMAKVSVHIKHISWRDGKPRFQPSKSLRAAGFKGQDLRHGSGAWYTLNETQEWVTQKIKEIDNRRTITARPSDQHPSPQKRNSSYFTVSNLFERFFESAKFKKLAERTRKDYREKARRWEEYDLDLYHAPLKYITRPMAYKIYEKLVNEKGVGTARARIAVLSAAISWGIRTGVAGIDINPCANLGMSLPPPRVRAGTVEEMRVLIAAADALGRPDMGDAITLGLWTGQRQGDRLRFMFDSTAHDGKRISLKQHKTNKIVSIPAAADLKHRLEANAKRREKSGKEKLPFAVINETTNRQFTSSNYSRTVVKIRNAAVEGIQSKDGKGWLIPPTPSLADFTDQDLRDTAVTWLARSGASIPEIAAITGHTLQSITNTLKHYLEFHPEIADNAIDKMVAWHTKKQEETK